MAIDWDHLVVGPTVAVFGEPVTYNLPSGAVMITGVFDEAYIEMTPLGTGGADAEAFALGMPGAINTEMPVLGVQLSQFTTGELPCQNDTLVARGNTYVVKDVRVDSHGWALLLMNLLHLGA